jgi:ATP-binding cassette, subfamily B, bacterial HlyB/CyaB
MHIRSGSAITFQTFAGRLSGPLLRMVGLWQEFQTASIAVKRIGDVMNAPTEPYSMVPAREGGGKCKLEIKNLSFRYAENLPYLYRDLNLTIEPGRCIALMGPSGSGKSTLAKLMQGFYMPNDGAILIDDRDIRHFSANEQSPRSPRGQTTDIFRNRAPWVSASREPVF